MGASLPRLYLLTVIIFLSFLVAIVLMRRERVEYISYIVN